MDVKLDRKELHGRQDVFFRPLKLPLDAFEVLDGPPELEPVGLIVYLRRLRFRARSQEMDGYLLLHHGGWCFGLQGRLLGRCGLLLPVVLLWRLLPVVRHGAALGFGLFQPVHLRRRRET